MQLCRNRNDRNSARRETSAPRPPGTEPALRAIAMPADANPPSDIFGGWLLRKWISPAARLPPAAPGATGGLTGI
jgi:acyl-CoA hydrolase